MSKYKVGDKVRVRSDLEVNECYGKSHLTFIEEMMKFRGKEVTISSVDFDGDYHIEECGYWWVDEMFEGLAEEQDFHFYDTVRHRTYGIGTVIGIGKSTLAVDFDEKPFTSQTNIVYGLPKENITLVKAYLPN